MTLRRILESHGIEVKFENLVLTGADIASGVRVKINEKNLALALKIVESGDLASLSKEEMRLAGISGNVLIPVDFSPYSGLAAGVGLQLAAILRLDVVFMHTFATSYFGGNLAYSNVLDPGEMNVEANIAEMEADRDMQAESERLMKEFTDRIRRRQEAGELPDVKFTTTISEGIPEEVIQEYCRLTPPALVVMGTRGKNKKEEELVGSVTAEVLDSCRVPILAIPENFGKESIDDIKKVAYFCNLDQQDIISIDTLMRLFDFPQVEVTLIPVNERAGSRIREKVGSLCEYFTKNYPGARFSTAIFSEKEFREGFEDLVKDKGIEMLIVPNKKRNILSRLFNPGIAHKLLFERDMPMLALPV